jgi:hypothetical protein
VLWLPASEVCLQDQSFPSILAPSSAQRICCGRCSFEVRVLLLDVSRAEGEREACYRTAGSGAQLAQLWAFPTHDDEVRYPMTCQSTTTPCCQFIAIARARPKESTLYTQLHECSQVGCRCCQVGCRYPTQPTTHTPTTATANHHTSDPHQPSYQQMTSRQRDGSPS